MFEVLLPKDNDIYEYLEEIGFNDSLTVELE